AQWSINDYKEQERRRLQGVLQGVDGVNNYPTALGAGGTAASSLRGEHGHALSSAQPAVAPGSLSCVPWAPRPNIERRQKELAMAARTASSAGAVPARQVEDAHRTAYERAKEANERRAPDRRSKAHSVEEELDDSVQLKRKQAWEALSDKGDLDAFLGANKPKGPVKAFMAVATRGISITSSSLSGVSGLQLKISAPTTERANAAGAGARPKAMAREGPLAEAKRQRQEDAVAQEEFERMQKEAKKFVQGKTPKVSSGQERRPEAPTDDADVDSRRRSAVGAAQTDPYLLLGEEAAAELSALASAPGPPSEPEAEDDFAAEPSTRRRDDRSRSRDDVRRRSRSYSEEVPRSRQQRYDEDEDDEDRDQDQEDQGRSEGSEDGFDEDQKNPEKKDARKLRDEWRRKRKKEKQEKQETQPDSEAEEDARVRAKAKKQRPVKRKERRQDSRSNSEDERSESYGQSRKRDRGDRGDRGDRDRDRDRGDRGDRGDRERDREEDEEDDDGEGKDGEKSGLKTDRRGPKLATDVTNNVPVKDKSLVSYGGVVTDAELDRRLRLAQQAEARNSSGPLMTEAEVLAKLNRAKNKNSSRRR
ncbi:unnamed protein product, partial [Polarella glacialis]